MKFVEPKAIFLAQTKLDQQGMADLMVELGVPEWSTNAQSDGEELIEVGGRLCYKAFGTELNPNLTKVREGNFQYIGNILEQKHGSVIAHATATFVFLNVSRILTHEQVRHSAGTAYSQESGRFVRIDDISMTNINDLLGSIISEVTPLMVNPDSTPDLHEVHQVQAQMYGEVTEAMQEAVKASENAASKIRTLFGMDSIAKLPFGLKKKMTSFIRRIFPEGRANNIMVTANHRAWRHIIESRTAAGAEEEIRTVIYDVAKQLKKRFPALYQDLIRTPVENSRIPAITFRNQKV